MKFLAGIRDHVRETIQRDPFGSVICVIVPSIIVAVLLAAYFGG